MFSFSETFSGEGGDLDVDYWVLDHQRETAKKHFKEAPRTLRAFEHWFGQYPFYEDSYKLVVVPYLGMEHQSSVTYGNGFKNGYRGRDLSATGVGLKFDFIIVHESGHEWFGNNISMKMLQTCGSTKVLQTTLRIYLSSITSLKKKRKTTS